MELKEMVNELLLKYWSGNLRQRREEQTYPKKEQELLGIPSHGAHLSQTTKHINIKCKMQMT